MTNSILNCYFLGEFFLFFFLPCSFFDFLKFENGNSNSSCYFQMFNNFVYLYSTLSILAFIIFTFENIFCITNILSFNNSFWASFLDRYFRCLSRVLSFIILARVGSFRNQLHWHNSLDMYLMGYSKSECLQTVENSN